MKKFSKQHWLEIQWTAVHYHKVKHAGEFEHCDEKTCTKYRAWLRSNINPNGWRCKFCALWPKEHAAGKCLFGPTYYDEMSEHERLQHLQQNTGSG